MSKKTDTLLDMRLNVERRRDSMGDAWAAAWLAKIDAHLTASEEE